MSHSDIKGRMFSKWYTIVLCVSQVNAQEAYQHWGSQVRCRFFEGVHAVICNFCQAQLLTRPFFSHNLYHRFIFALTFTLSQPMHAVKICDWLRLQRAWSAIINIPDQHYTYQGDSEAGRQARREFGFMGWSSFYLFVVYTADVHPRFKSNLVGWCCHALSWKVLSQEAYPDFTEHAWLLPSCMFLCPGLHSIFRFKEVCGWETMSAWHHTSYINCVVMVAVICLAYWGDRCITMYQIDSRVFPCAVFVFCRTRWLNRWLKSVRFAFLCCIGNKYPSMQSRQCGCEVLGCSFYGLSSGHLHNCLPSFVIHW